MSLIERGDKRGKDKYFCVEADCVHAVGKQRLEHRRSVLSLFPLDAEHLHFKKLLLFLNFLGVGRQVAFLS